MQGWRDDALWDAVSSKVPEAVRAALRKVPPPSALEPQIPFVRPESEILFLQGADPNSIAPDGWVRAEHSGVGGKSILHHAAYVGHLLCFKMFHTGSESVTCMRLTTAP